MKQTQPVFIICLHGNVAKITYEAGESVCVAQMITIRTGTRAIIGIGGNEVLHGYWVAKPQSQA